MPDKSVELGAVFGDYDDTDYEHFGGRFNYKANPTTVAYGDIGQTSVDGAGEADGITYGLGGYWQLDGVFTGSEFGVHASFHKYKLEASGSNREVSGNSIMIEALFSGKDPINTNGNIFWNGSVGLNRSSAKLNGGSSESDTELTFSGGIVMRTAAETGEFYAGFYYLDDPGFGAGYRHFLK